MIRGVSLRAMVAELTKALERTISDDDYGNVLRLSSSRDLCYHSMYVQSSVSNDWYRGNEIAHKRDDLAIYVFLCPTQL